MAEERSILIVAGTTEGRNLAEYISESLTESLKDGNWNCYVSAATEYGKQILEEENLEGIRLISGRMDEEQLEEFIIEHCVNYVIDATHPFARVVTENLKKVCQGQKITYIRCLREQTEHEITDSGKKAMTAEKIVVTESVEDAAEFLKQTEGKILLTTGSKELAKYTVIPDYRERCYARVLSTLKAVQDSVELGFTGKHLIAMQGPFSVEMNLAVLHQTEAKYFVTKESGTAGGFEEKVLAAEQAGAVLVVIGRPQEEGLSVEETCRYLKEILRTK